MPPPEEHRSTEEPGQRTRILVVEDEYVVATEIEA